VTEQDDKYAERRELVAAGWEPKDAEDTVVWKSPSNGYWYPQDLAVQLSRTQAGNHAPKRRRGGRS
jgi:hypothetical protein